MKEAKTLYRLVILISVYVVMGFSACAGDSVEGRAGAMDRLLADIYPAEGPGAAVLVVKEGQTILRKAYGMGNIELNIALRPDMVFRIGSISKQFTSAAIMKLVEAGKIKLSDPITDYLPDYPVHGHHITIENLLTHTSGIQSYTNVAETMKTIANEDVTVQELIDSFKNDPMNFAPSTTFLYNNSGYVLLGAIIEKLSGKSYEEYIQTEIFTPLHMTQSYYGSLTKIIPGRASGYTEKDSTVKNAEYISMRVPYAAGSLLSTVDDLQKWNKALYAGKVVSKESLRKMTTPYVLSNGKNAGSDKKGQGYGYALSMVDLKGHRVVGHTGGINGFVTRLQRIEDEDLLVIVLTNSLIGAVNPATVAHQLSAIAMGNPFVPPSEVKINRSLLKKYIGDYAIENKGGMVTISYDEGNLYSQRTGRNRVLLHPSSKTDFFVRNDLARASFMVEKNARPSQVKFYNAEGAPGAEFTAIRKQ